MDTLHWQSHYNDKILSHYNECITAVVTWLNRTFIRKKPLMFWKHSYIKHPIMVSLLINTIACRITALNAWICGSGINITCLALPQWCALTRKHFCKDILVKHILTLYWILNHVNEMCCLFYKIYHPFSQLALMYIYDDN